jgi:hypothetical protein
MLEKSMRINSSVHGPRRESEVHCMAVNNIVESGGITVEQTNRITI